MIELPLFGLRCGFDWTLLHELRDVKCEFVFSHSEYLGYDQVFQTDLQPTSSGYPQMLRPPSLDKGLTIVRLLGAGMIRCFYLFFTY